MNLARGVRLKKKMQPRALVLYKQTAISAAIVDGVTQNLMIRPRPVNTAFAQGVDSKKMIKMKNFVLIVMSAANKKVIGIIEKVLQKDFTSSKELKTCR